MRGIKYSISLDDSIYIECVFSAQVFISVGNEEA